MDEGKFDLELSADEERKVAEKTSIGAVVLHEAIRSEGEAELKRSNSALIWSALASGLSMGFSTDNGPRSRTTTPSLTLPSPLP